jgi:hypothetical protein
MKYYKVKKINTNNNPFIVSEDILTIMQTPNITLEVISEVDENGHTTQEALDLVNLINSESTNRRTTMN